MKLAQMVIKPTLNWSHKQAALRYEGRFLTREDYDQLVAKGVVGVLPSGETQFLFLTKLIPQHRCRQIYENLRQIQCTPVKASHRAALKGSPAGGHLVMGFIRDKISKGPRYSAPTQQYPELFAGIIVPLVNFVNGLVKKHLPEYWRAQRHRAARNGSYLIRRIFFNRYH